MPKKPAKPAPPPRKSAWTFLVYLAGDNNLTQEMTWGLQELKKTANHLNARVREGKLVPSKKSDQINVVAHFDPRGSRSRRYDFFPLASNNECLPGEAQEDGNLDQFEAMIFTDTVVEARTQEIEKGPADPAGQLRRRFNQVSAFLRDQIKRLLPAKEYFLVLSGHGSGAVGDFLTARNPDASLSIPELARILEEGREYFVTTHSQFEADRKTPKRISILGMDSCLMSNAEVCVEICEHARYLVASEGWVSNTGWPYHRVLEGMIDQASQRPGEDPRKVAEQVVRSYAAFYRDYEVSELSTDIAVCDLDAFGADGDLVGRLRDLSRECIPRLEAVHVGDVLDRTPVESGKAKAVLEQLGKEIAADLLPDGRERDTLAELLGGGRDATLKEARAARHRKLSISQVEALRELLDSIDRRYHADGSSLDERLAADDDRWREELDKPSSLSNALAAVRVLREFDPGVQEALRRIERIEKEDPAAESLAKRARARLQKLHQVRWLLDLHELAKGAPSDDDRRLRDALVAARWEAQSFKAGFYVDLYDLCASLGNRLPRDEHLVGSMCQRIQQAVVGTDEGKSGAVLVSSYTGPAFQHAHGLSVYFPFAAGDYALAYENLEFAKQTGWGRFVRAYLRVTRRGRRDEQTHWAEADAAVLRFGSREVDPLEGGGIEARIAGVTGPPPKECHFLPKNVQCGKEAMLRAVVEEQAHRAGGEERIRAGGEERIRAGGEERIKGKSILTEFGNPPDGFFRQ